MAPAIPTLPRSVFLALCLFLGPAQTPLLGAGDAAVRLVDAYPGVTFTRLVFAAQPPDSTPRMFVAEQDGRLVVVDHPAPPPPARRKPNRS